MPTYRMTSSRALYGWLALAAAVIVIDQITKALIVQWLPYGATHYVWPWFDIVRAHNTGAAFSFLAGASGWQRWFFVVLGLGVSAFIVWMIRRHPGQKLFCFAVSMILGGAVGNVIDRLLHGHVVDFLQVHWRSTWYFPAFNAADSAITLGAACLVLDEVLRVRRGR